MTRVLTIAEREQRHSAQISLGRMRAAAIIRCEVRATCAAAGIAVPAWAGLSEAHAKRAAGNRVATGFRRPRSVPVAANTPAVSTEIPAELRAWRMRTPGACVQIRRDGVTLRTFKEQRFYSTVADAVEAVGAQ